jgi:hypothetical protein
MLHQADDYIQQTRHCKDHPVGLQVIHNSIEALRGTTHDQSQHTEQWHAQDGRPSDTLTTWHKPPGRTIYPH